uniref:Uncharacterized protein n=1 Tax=Rhipicephalus microplus TaxID=6941 RepID=A0A6G5AGA3_RHIMP
MLAELYPCGTGARNPLFRLRGHPRARPTRHCLYLVLEASEAVATTVAAAVAASVAASVATMSVVSTDEMRALVKLVDVMHGLNQERRARDSLVVSIAVAFVVSAISAVAAKASEATVVTEVTSKDGGGAGAQEESDERSVHGDGWRCSTGGLKNS